MTTANPFQQYAQQPSDPAALNPFEQYAQPPQPQLPAGHDKRSYGLGEVPLNAAINAPSSAWNMVKGVASAIANPIDTGMGVWDAAAGALRKSLPKRVVDFMDELDTPSGRVAAERATKVAEMFGESYKDKYGSYESIKRTFAEDPIAALSDLSMILGAAGKVAKITGAQKTAAGLSAMSAATNPMTPVVAAARLPGKAVSGIAKTSYNRLDPKSVLYNEALEGRGAQVLNALRDNVEIVPGSRPTAAQAASNAGATKFSALGKSVQEINPTAYFEQAQAQKAAQLAAVRSVGKTVDDLDAARKLRTGAARELYGISDKATVGEDVISNMSTPAMQKALAEAKEIAANKGIPLMVDGRYTGQGLHLIKESLDDMIKDPERFGIGASKQNAIRDVRTDFLNAVEGSLPEYKTARTTHAKLSEPINQMQVGQFLESKLTPALGEETARLRSSGYASALDQASGTIKKSTGQTRFQKLEEIMTPDQMKILKSVEKDLARNALTELQASAASGAVDATRGGAAALGGIRAPGFINRVTTVANEIMRRLEGKLDREVAMQLATEMLDPKLAARGVEKALMHEQVGKRLGAPFKATGKVYSKGLDVAKTPGAANALSQIHEINNRLAEQESNR